MILFILILFSGAFNHILYIWFIFVPSIFHLPHLISPLFLVRRHQRFCVIQLCIETKLTSDSCICALTVPKYVRFDVLNCLIFTRSLFLSCDNEQDDLNAFNETCKSLLVALFFTVFSPALILKFHSFNSNDV